MIALSLIPLLFGSPNSALVQKIAERYLPGKGYASNSITYKTHDISLGLRVTNDSNGKPLVLELIVKGKNDEEPVLHIKDFKCDGKIDKVNYEGKPINPLDSTALKKIEDIYNKGLEIIDIKDSLDKKVEAFKKGIYK